ncbi:MAG: A24 family peptidase [Planctomycetota bacterium]
MYLLALGATSIATAFDLKSRRIPNAIPGALLLCAAVLTALGRHPLGWTQALYGFGAATLITLPLFAKGWFGGGDTKLAMALGATLGLLPFLVFFAAMSLFGGFLALRAKRAGETEIAYAPAMLLGLLLLLPLQWAA